MSFRLFGQVKCPRFKHESEKKNGFNNFYLGFQIQTSLTRSGD